MWRIKKEEYKKIFIACVGMMCFLVVLECALQLHNPFPTRLKGDQIILPVNRTYKFMNKHIRGLDKEIQL